MKKIISDHKLSITQKHAISLMIEIHGIDDVVNFFIDAKKDPKNNNHEYINACLKHVSIKIK